MCSLGSMVTRITLGICDHLFWRGQHNFAKFLKFNQTILPFFLVFPTNHHSDSVSFFFPEKVSAKRGSPSYGGGLYDLLSSSSHDTCTSIRDRKHCCLFDTDKHGHDEMEGLGFCLFGSGTGNPKVHYHPLPKSWGPFLGLFESFSST